MSDLDIVVVHCLHQDLMPKIAREDRAAAARRKDIKDNQFKKEWL